MKTLRQETLPNNTGAAYVLKKSQRMRVSATTIVDLVAFDHADLRERLDQAETKAQQRKIFLSTGDLLLARSGRPLLRIVEDTYKEGTHDLEKGMCSASAYSNQLKDKMGRLEKHDERAVREVPTHGCWENLTQALAPWGIAPEDIPNPFNVFMTMAIDAKANTLAMTKIRPAAIAHVDFIAEVDCLVGISACPDTMVGGKPVAIMVYE
jgi:uncharacterized protein YcgI (DUF1989 family)